MIVDDKRLDAIEHKLKNILSYVYCIKDDTLIAQMNSLHNMFIDMVAEED